MEKGDKELFYSFLAGSLVGASIALLVAPRSGDETRESLKKISQDVKDTVNLTRFVKEI